MSPPIPTQTKLVAQNSATGAVDFLTFNGGTLVGSDTVDYGLGPSWRVVTNGIFGGAANNDLLEQNTVTGQTDILYLDQNNNLVSSAVSSAVMPRIVGETGSIQLPPTTLVSQLPNGSLDLLELNRSGQLVASDLVPGTAGLPQAVGVGQGYFEASMLKGLVGNLDVVTQFPNGSVDLIGLNTNFPNGISASYTSSYLLTATSGFGPIEDVNPNYLNNSNLGANGGQETMGFVFTTPSGQFDAAYFDSGYNDPGKAGNLFASMLFSLSMPGWTLANTSF